MYGGKVMHNLLYYPYFEIQDENFLKFALLYIDEIRPIIPETARNSLSSSMKNIMEYTDLINPYAPEYFDGLMASEGAVQYLQTHNINRWLDRVRMRNVGSRSICTLYSDKYTYDFEKFCLDNRLGERCNEGIQVHKDIAYTYMSMLAEIISKGTGLDMVTDIMKYTYPTLRYSPRTIQRNMEVLNTIQTEIQFQVPVDMRWIPLEQFIELRSDNRFEEARRNFVTELNKVLDNGDIQNIDLKDLMECRKEIYSLIWNMFPLCGAVILSVCSFINAIAPESIQLDFWNFMGNAAVTLSTMKNSAGLVEEFMQRMEGRRQARKYLARLGQLRPNIL